MPLHADKHMEMATNSILAGYCWAKKWPHVAKLLELIDKPDFYEDTGKFVKSSNGCACILHFCMLFIPVLVYR